MKMNVSVFCVGLFLVLSIVLQGCSFPWGSNGKSDNDKAAKKKNTEADEEATAQCTGGKFSCKGNWRQWCAQQEKRCSGNAGGGSRSCMPQCTWECDTNGCDQTCAPKCGRAMCSTRCKGFNTNTCKMKCGKPDCKVVCPKKFCPGQNCAACNTECGKPVCKMECKDSEQNCRHVCAPPRCKWECKKPKECPKPKCHMKCQKPRNCMDNTHMVQSLPPMAPGETEVTSFQTPKSLLQNFAAGVDSRASTLRVNITTMRQDLSLHSGEVDLQLAPMDAMDAMDAVLVTWTKSIRKHGGRVTEREASCKKGSFRCEGDAAWCTAEKEKLACKRSDAVEAAELRAAQAALQPEVSVEVAATAETADSAEEKEAEGAAAQALKAASDSAFLQQRVGKQGHLQA